MTPTPEIEEQGLKAYEQAGAFERLRGWRLPLSYVIFSLIPILNGMMMWKMGHHTMAMLNFLTALFFVAGSWFHWKRLCARYAKNLELLREMEAKYGDKLPWMEVEQHLAAMEQLTRDLEEEKRRME